MHQRSRTWDDGSSPGVPILDFNKGHDLWSRKTWVVLIRRPLDDSGISFHWFGAIRAPNSCDSGGGHCTDSEAIEWMIRGFHSTDSGPFELQILLIRGLGLYWFGGHWMIRGFHSTDSGPFELQFLVIRGGGEHRPLNDSGVPFRWFGAIRTPNSCDSGGLYWFGGHWIVWNDHQRIHRIASMASKGSHAWKGLNHARNGVILLPGHMKVRFGPWAAEGHNEGNTHRFENDDPKKKKPPSVQSSRKDTTFGNWLAMSYISWKWRRTATNL